MDSFSLTELVTELLDAAAGAGNGRSARTIHGGHGHALRHTMVALLGGAELGEHDSPGEATLQVLRGRVILRSGDESWDGAAGSLLVIPHGRHNLLALENSVVLLTVAVELH